MCEEEIGEWLSGFRNPTVLGYAYISDEYVIAVTISHDGPMVVYVTGTGGTAEEPSAHKFMSKEGGGMRHKDGPTHLTL